MMHILLVLFVSHFWHFFYWGSPWYTGAIWSNVFVILIVAPLGWLWSKSKFWPLNLVHKKLDSLHEKHDAHAQQLKALHQSVQELHEKHDRLAKRFNSPGRGRAGDPPKIPPPFWG